MPIAISILFMTLAGAAIGAAAVVHRLPTRIRADRCAAVIAFGTIAVAWCLCAGLAPAALAEFVDAPLVRPFAICGISVAAALAMLARTFLRRVDVMAVPVVSRTNRRAAGRRRWFWILAIAPVFALHAALMMDSALRPPMSYDGLYYRLPILFRWLDAGRLSIDPDIPEFCLSGNGELWLLLFAAARVDALIELSMVPIGAMLAIVVFAIARWLGASRVGAVSATLMALVSPMVALQCYSSYIDLFGATFFAASLYWTMMLARRLGESSPARAEGALAGLSLGVAIGTKLTFVAWGAFLIAALAAFVVRRVLATRPVPERRRPIAPALLAFTLALPAASAFWYARNTAVTGWPLYPFTLAIGSWTIGNGVPTDALVGAVPHAGWSYLAYPWFEWKRAGYGYAIDAGLGPAFAAFAILGAAYLTFRPRRGAASAADGRWWIVATLAAGVALWFGCFETYPRYALPLWIFAIAACAPLVDVLLRAAPRWSAPLFVTTLALSAATVGFWPMKSLAARVHGGDLSRAAAYELPPLIDELRAGTVILNLNDDTKNFPLLGVARTNVVIDTLTARKLGLTAPLTADDLVRHRVDIVYLRGHGPHPFAPDVRFTAPFDDRTDASRPATTTPTRMLRVTPRQASQNDKIAP